MYNFPLRLQRLQKGDIEHLTSGDFWKVTHVSAISKFKDPVIFALLVV